MSLTDAELSQMRTDAQNLTMPGTAVIWRTSGGTVSDAYGGPSGADSAVGTVACRIMPERDMATKQWFADRQITYQLYKAVLPFDADIQSDDYLVVGSDTYEVVALWDDHDFRTARRVMLGKLDT